jgi:hypothetical protein
VIWFVLFSILLFLIHFVVFVDFLVCYGCY